MESLLDQWESGAPYSRPIYYLLSITQVGLSIFLVGAPGLTPEMEGLLSQRHLVVLTLEDLRTFLCVKKNS